MLKFRAWEIWDWFIFPESSDSAGAKTIVSGIWTAVGALLGFFVLMGTASTDAYGSLILSTGDPTLMFILPVIFFLMSFLGRINIRNGIPYDGYYNSGVGNQLRYRVKFYAELPAADRALYPHDILKTVKHPDLDNSQRQKLNDGMLLIENKIKEREEVKRQLSLQKFDIDGLTERMVDSSQSVKAEVDTYKEFLL